MNEQHDENSGGVLRQRHPLDPEPPRKDRDDDSYKIPYDGNFYTKIFIINHSKNFFLDLYILSYFGRMWFMHVACVCIFYPIFCICEEIIKMIFCQKNLDPFQNPFFI